jgi:hypothetical protein
VFQANNVANCFNPNVLSKHLDGDCHVLVSDHPMGPVLRKTIQGYDCVFKLFLFDQKVPGNEELFEDRLKNERDVYFHLRKLQGKTIPKLLWYGTFPRLAKVLVTEYSIFRERSL